MTKRELRYLERVQILRTLINYGPMLGSEIVARANTECDHDALESLPDISRRGIGSKLSGMWWDGMVVGEPDGRRPMVWHITDHGRKVAAVFEAERLTSPRTQPKEDR